MKCGASLLRVEEFPRRRAHFCRLLKDDTRGEIKGGDATALVLFHCCRVIAAK